MAITMMITATTPTIHGHLRRRFGVGVGGGGDM
jgi:hypothetical protein